MEIKHSKIQLKLALKKSGTNYFLFLTIIKPLTNDWILFSKLAKRLLDLVLI